MKKFYSLLFLIAIGGFLSAQQVFTTFQNASMVIGQPDFSSIIYNTSDSITYGPSYCAISSKGMLAVAEQSGASVKIWFTMPKRNGQPSDIQLSIPFDAEGLDWSPDGNKLIVAGGDSYIYIWNTVPTSNDQPADVTISNYYQSPQGVLVTPNGKLLIAERYANRILVWNSIPTVNNTPANYVIGQPDMTTTSPGNAAGKLNEPWGIDLSPDGKLLIADEQNHRVVVYDSVPEGLGDTATVVIGHTNFGDSNSGCSDSTQNTTVGVTVTVDGIVAISEFGNNRVTIFNSVPTSNNAKATAVLGQPDFSTSAYFYPDGNPDTNNISTPYCISSDLNGRLFLCGRDMSRVMVFGKLPSESADLKISMAAASTSLCDSSMVTYAVKIKNLGPDTAKNIISTTAFGSGFILKNISTGNGSYLKASGYWNIPSVSPGDSAILHLSGIVDTSMTGKDIVSYANIINSSAVDTNLNNNGTNSSVIITSFTRPGDPIVNISDTLICSGTSATLTASGTGTLNWYANADDIIPVATGSTFNTPDLRAPATFYVETMGDCPSTNRIPVYVHIKTVNTAVTQDNSTLTAEEAAGTYQWINCSDNTELEGETSQSFTSTETGNFAVIVSKDNCVDTSDCYSIIINGIINRMNNSGITSFPNPVKTDFTIDLGKIYHEVSVTILNISGKQVKNKTFFDMQQLNMNVQDLASGVYLVQIRNAQKISMLRIVKE